MSLRGCNEWRKENLPMNSTSDEAVRLFDASLMQLVRWRENVHTGGIDADLERMLRADPDFVMGRVLKSGVEMIGSSGKYNEENMNELVDLSNRLSSNLTKRELNHVEAVKHLYTGNANKACDLWETILVENPTDMLAVKFAHDVYFYLGSHAIMRDSVARVLPYWKKSMPLYGNLHSMHSFGLVQSNLHEEARRSALFALELDKYDAWATHTICHYNEYRVEPDHGIDFLRRTENYWSKCNLLSTHNYWHWALYYLEKGEHDKALEIYDQRVCEYLQQRRTLDFVDIVSFLYRLKLDGCNVEKEKWLQLKDLYYDRIRDHRYCFNDAHVMMILSSSDAFDEKEEFFSSLNDYLHSDLTYLQEDKYDSLDSYSAGGNNNNNNNNNSVNKERVNYFKKVNKELGVNLYQAIWSFDEGNFSQVVELLNPIRYDLIRIGGSNAQRDLFQQMLIQSALRSEFKHHNKLGIALLNERKALKPNSMLTSRLAARFASIHLIN